MTKHTQWGSISAIEPRLLLLEHDIKRVALEFTTTKPEKFCANSFWYGPNGFRRRLNDLVGFEAQQPEIRTSEAWDAAFARLYSLLPDCKHDGVCWGSK